VYFYVVVFWLGGMENNPDNGMAKLNDTNFFAFISGLSNMKPEELYGVAVSHFDVYLYGVLGPIHTLCVTFPFRHRSIFVPSEWSVFTLYVVFSHLPEQQVIGGL